jgi:hypothetical protein
VKRIRHKAQKNLFDDNLEKRPENEKKTDFFQNSVSSGVDVMIRNSCDFSQFSSKKLAFFLNTNVVINFFQNLALF